MSISTALFGLLPIIIFVIVDLLASPKMAIYISVLTAVFMTIFYYIQFGEWDFGLTAELVLFVVFGAVAIKMNSPKLFKFQPVVVGVITAAFLAGYQLLYGPYFLKALELMEKMSPEIARQINNPRIQEVMAQFSFQAMFILLFHALVLAWLALRKGTIAWGLWRMAIWPILMAVLIADNW